MSSLACFCVHLTFTVFPASYCVPLNLTVLRRLLMNLPAFYCVPLPLTVLRGVLMYFPAFYCVPLPHTVLRRLLLCSAAC
jgi:hypothetical protein